MKQLSKHIALFLTLFILSNGVFAAQMTVSMVEDAIKIEAVEDQLPCHNENAEPTMDCCQGDCGSCVLSSSVSVSIIVDSPKPPLDEILVYINKHLPSAHSSNLYKPPIQS